MKESASQGAAIAAAILTMVAGASAGDEWGKPNKEGVATRVVVTGEDFRVGKPIVVRIEAKNTGAKLVYADTQSFAHTDTTLDLVDREGNPVAVIGSSVIGFQTMADYISLPPGKVVVLGAQLDLTEEFAIFKAGAYRVKYRGVQYAPIALEGNFKTPAADGEWLDRNTIFTQVPESPPVEVVVKAGELTREMAMIQALQPIVPEDWYLCRRRENRGVTMGHHGELARVSIDLVALDPKRWVAREEGHRTLGEGPLGGIRMGVSMWGGKGVGKPPEGAVLDDFWKGAENTIRKAFGIAAGGA